MRKARHLKMLWLLCLLDSNGMLCFLGASSSVQPSVQVKQGHTLVYLPLIRFKSTLRVLHHVHRATAS